MRKQAGLVAAEPTPPASPFWRLTGRPPPWNPPYVHGATNHILTATAPPRCHTRPSVPHHYLGHRVGTTALPHLAAVTLRLTHIRTRTDPAGTGGRSSQSTTCCPTGPTPSCCWACR